MRQETGAERLEWWSAGMVEWWSTKRRPRKSAGLLDIPALIFCREDAEEESGLGTNTERCFPILAPDS
jgi:hypothetical protein